MCIAIMLTEEQQRNSGPRLSACSQPQTFQSPLMSIWNACKIHVIRKQVSSPNSSSAMAATSSAPAASGNPETSCCVSFAC